MDTYEDKQIEGAYNKSCAKGLSIEGFGKDGWHSVRKIVRTIDGLHDETFIFICNILWKYGSEDRWDSHRYIHVGRSTLPWLRLLKGFACTWEF